MLSAPPARLARSVRMAHCSPGSAAKGEDLGNPVVVDHVREAVGAEHHAVAVQQPKAFDFDHRVGGGGADGIGQDVAQVLRAPLDRRQPLRVGELLLDRVIARQQGQGAVTKQIRARVSDVRDEQVVAGGVGRGEGGRHALERRVGARLRAHCGVRLRVEPFGALEDLRRGRRIDAHVPLAVVKPEVRDGAERHAARHRARLRPRRDRRRRA